ncbi:hypothetical protein GOP47_0029645 [Adiantum capillus-veneris]|nr:hypothetical protein GOP47_0029645 [Adiantum capillus-veneris]
MKENQLSCWVSYPDLENSGNGGDGDRGYDKGWITPNGEEDPFLVAHLHLIAHMAIDRAEMHSILAQQRDNWNKLFQSSLIALAMASTILSALSGFAPNICFSLPACTINLFLAFIMIGFNHFQPSQLAEEQRTAARLSKKLAHDIEFTLKIAPHLRQHAYGYVREATERLHAIDKAYPLPLTPMVVEKFPKKVRAPVLSKHVDEDVGFKNSTQVGGNGWEEGIAQTLQRVGELMVKGDARVYKERAERAKKMNLACAVVGPLCAGVGAALNLIGVMKEEGLIGGALHMNVGVIAAMASTFAAFVAIFSHDAQLGMIFELFRSSMGYFEEIDASITRAVSLPVEKRENGVLFMLQVAYELGHRVEDLATLNLSSHKTAGALF